MTYDEDASKLAMTVTTGASAGAIATPALPGTPQALVPVLQAQDGSFVGTFTDSDTGDSSMIAFDQGGGVRWSVPNEQPQIATADGGVIGQSGITYTQNGSASGQIDLPTYSWTGNAYQIGSTDQRILGILNMAVGWSPHALANLSGNVAAAFPRDWKSNYRVADILTGALWQKFANSNCSLVLGNHDHGIPSMIGADYYPKWQMARQKQHITNFYDVGNPGVADLELQTVTGGQFGGNLKLINYIQNADANAATANMGYGKQTAVVLKSAVLSQPHPEITLMHEVLFHAYAAQSDGQVFGNDFFVKQNGLWNDGKGSTTISAWMSTDCKCTPGNPSTPQCQANTAGW